MRLFIGIPLSESIRRGLGSRAEALRPQISKGKMADWSGYHLTLKFIGEVPEETAEQLKSIIEETRFSTGPFELRLSGLGHFTKKGGDVLWIGIPNPGPLLTLQNEVEGLSEKVGLPEESRAYSPHVTLGRGIRYVSDFEELDRKWSPEPFCDKVDRIALFQSTQIEGKLSYVPLLTRML